MPTITGKVLERWTKRPVVGAIVKVRGTGYSTFTDPSGFFSVQSPTGKVKVEVEHSDFRPIKPLSLNVRKAEVGLGTILMQSVVRAL